MDLVMFAKFKKFRSAFTIVELLIGLAITAILIAAIATAFDAAMINYERNEDLFKSINTARQALFRITTQLRTAGAVDPNAPQNQCTMLTSEGDDITYSYDSSDNKLYLVTNDDTSDSNYVLCDSVTAMTFEKTTAVIDSVLCVKSVQISMTVVTGDVQKTVTAAAVVRRNL